MILVDLSQVMISNVMMSLKKYNNELEEDMIRFHILNSLRSYNSKFRATYGELIICCDDTNLWRKKVFPYYKANRKKAREESTIDWAKLFGIINTVRDEIKDNFAYRVIQVPTAEADDVIAVLASENSQELINNNNRILIVSGDKDYQQLQRFPNVQQYDPVQKKMVVTRDPYAFLREHIIRGDVGDGVPNFLSNDNCLVMSIRQTPISKTKLDVWLKAEPEDFCTDESMLRGFRRNESLIDLTKIPDDVKQTVLETYEAQAGKKKDKMLRYFMHHRLSKFMDSLTDF